MPFQRSLRGSNHRSQRRKTAWDLGPGGTAATAVTDGTAAFLGLGGTPIIPGLTLIRTRGTLQIFQTLATGAGDGFHGAVGIGIVTDKAFAGGIGVVPSPLTDSEDELWLWHTFFDVHSPTATLNTGAGPSSLRMEVDSKAMRKVAIGEVMFAIVDQVESGTAGMTVFFDSRMLFKLP